MGKSRAILLVVILFLAPILFAAGYWIERHRDEQDSWEMQSRTPVVPPPQQSGKDRAAAPRSSGILFEEVAARAGINFTFHDGAEGNMYIVETAGGGVGVFDFNQDGLLDFFFPNGVRLRADLSDDTHRSGLYARRGNDLAFEDVARPAGVDLIAYAEGAATGDYDNDGFDDLFVTGFGRTVLYHNAGDGTFLDTTSIAGVSSDLWSTSAAFADLDADGSLDLYMCAYGEVSLREVLICVQRDVRIHCNPQKYRPQTDLLFRNRGDGAWNEVGQQAGIRDDTGRGFGVVIADLTGDGRPDIFVANDSSENFLFVNQDNFQFDEAALIRGVALTGAGHYMAGMGVACADYDHNEWLDLFVTNFYAARSALFRNLGTTGFFENADAAGLAAPSHNRLGFGANFLDADLDGNADLFVANGHVSDLTKLDIPYKMRQQLFRNKGDYTFADASDGAGPYFQRRLLGRGSATADVNDDGRPDIIVSHIGDPAALLVNRTEPHGHWLGLKLVGTRSNRNVINARVRISLGGKSQYHEVVAGGSYLSTSDRRLLIGLGSHQSVETLEVEWPSGQQQRWENLPIDRYHTIVEPHFETPHPGPLPQRGRE